MALLDYLLELPIIHRLGWTLLHFLWQGTLIGLACAILFKTALGRKPQITYRICIGALIVCAVCPILTFQSIDSVVKPPEVEPLAVDQSIPALPAAHLLPTPAASTNDATFVPAAAPSVSQPAEPKSPLFSIEKFSVWITPHLPWLVLAWIAGTSLHSIRLLCSWIEVRGFARRGTPTQNTQWTEKLRQLGQTMGVSTAVRLIESGELLSPMVLGAFRPMILVPVGFLTQLKPELVEAILLHELAHIRRHDYLINLLQALLRAVFFYHPAIWWLDRKTSAVREFCCDEMAAHAIRNPDLYASALEGLAHKQREGFGLAPAANDGSLVSRIRVVLGLGTLSAPSYKHLAGGALFLIFAIGLTTALHFSSALEAAEPVTPLLELNGVQGQVVDPHGHPVAGADVALYHLKYYYGLDNGIIETTKTDAEGRFSLETELQFFRNGRDNTRDAYAVLAWDTEHALAFKALNNLNAQNDTIELQLTPAVPRTIRVVDSQGSPVTEAEVFVHSLDERGNSALFANGEGPLSAQTNEDGIAQFNQLPASSVNFSAVKPGYADSWTGCGSVQSEAEIRLHPAGVVEGHVIDETGAPIPNVLICATPEWALIDYNYTRTDVTGHFRLDHLYGEGGCWTEDGGSGKYRISLGNEKYQAPAFEVHLQSGAISQGHVIEAQPATHISVIVRDPTTEAIVPFAQISIHTPGGKYKMESDAEGRLTFSTPPGKVHVTFWEPPKGTYVISGASKRDQPHFFDRMAGNEDQEWTLYAPSAVSQFTTLTGQVLFADGSPAEGVTLAAMLKQRHAQFVTQTFRSDSLRTIESDANGRFTFEQYPQGTSLSCLLRHKSKSLEALIDLPEVGPEGGDIGEVRLGKTITRTLEIVDLDGNPVKGSEIDYGPYTNPDLTRSRSVPTVDRDRLYRLKTDEKGKITLKSCLPKQAYDLWIGAERTSWKRILPQAMASDQPLRIVLDTRLLVSIKDTSGQTVKVTEITRGGFSEQKLNNTWNAIPILEHRTNGDLVISKESFQFNGPDSEISIWARTADGGQLNAKGRFPERGSHLDLTADSVFQAKAKLEAPASIKLGPNDLAFYVTDTEGKPIEGVAIESDPLSHGDRDHIKGTTNTDGWIVFRDAPSRIIYCEFNKDGYAPQWGADIALGNSISVTLSNQSRLRGQILAADGEAPGVVRMRFKTSRPKRWNDGRVNSVDNIPLTRETDAEGRYDFLINPGTYILKAESPTGGQLVLDQLQIKNRQTTALPDRLQPHIPTELHLIDSVTGEPVEGVSIDVRERIAPYYIGRRKDSQRVSDADGIVRWEGLLPGHVTFTCQSFRGFHDIPPTAYCRWWSLQHAHAFGRENAAQYSKVPPRGSDGVYDMTFDLSPENSRFEVMVERGIHVSGQVELPDDCPEGAITVTLVPMRGERTSLTGDSRDDVQVNREDGSFAAWLPAGNGLTYRACAYLAFNSNQATENFLPAAVSEPFESKPGDRFTFKLSMLGGGWLHGRVLDADGEPLEGVGIQAIPTDYHTGIGAEPVTQTDAEGRFSIGPIRATEYEVRIDQTSGVNIDRTVKAKAYITVKEGEDVAVDTLISP